MIDIELIRTNIEKVKESERKRFRSDSNVDLVYNLDEKWKKTRYEIDQLNKRMNIIQKRIKEIMKSKKNEIPLSKLQLNISSKIPAESQQENITPSLSNTNNLNSEMESLVDERNNMKISKDLLTQNLNDLEENVAVLLRGIGNIINENVVVSNDEMHNKLIRQYKSEREIKGCLEYPEIFRRIGGCDTERGARISGHRGYFLYDDIALLGMSLARYAIDFMRKKGFKIVQTPVFMSKNVMSKTAQLSDFDDQLYKIEGDNYLIATSEQPLSALHIDENLFELPLLYTGHSLCFRKEAGAHGKDNQGIFRVHQFEKIEQFVICEPEESGNWFEKMIKNVEEFYQSLDISYNVVSIVSGELNGAAAIKYDLECFFPGTGRYRELVSCSNCTDYQSRDLNVRFGYGKDNNVKMYVHMLNCTVVAVQRMLCCIVENYQDEEGVVVPEVLVKYLEKDKILYKK